MIAGLVLKCGKALENEQGYSWPIPQMQCLESNQLSTEVVLDLILFLPLLHEAQLLKAVLGTINSTVYGIIGNELCSSCT